MGNKAVNQEISLLPFAIDSIWLAYRFNCCIKLGTHQFITNKMQFYSYYVLLMISLCYWQASNHHSVTVLQISKVLNFSLNF